LLSRRSEVLIDRALVARDLQPRQGHARATRRRVVLVVAEPVYEERQLRVDRDVVDADLLPAQVEPVGPVAVSVGGSACQARFDRSDVVDADRPAEPAAPCLCAGAHGPTERRAIGGRMIECLDDLEVAAVGQGQHEVARAERRMQPAVGEPGTQS